MFFVKSQKMEKTRNSEFQQNHSVKMFSDAGYFANLDTESVKYLTDDTIDPYGSKPDETKKVGYIYKPGSESFCNPFRLLLSCRR